MGVFIKLAGQSGLSNEMVVFLRNCFGLLFLSPWLLRLRFSGLKTAKPLLHLLRASMGLAAMYCFFYAIPRINLAEAILLNYTIPLFTPLVAFYWLGERTSRATWWAIMTGLVGVILILKPGTSAFQPAAAVGLCAGVLAAVALTSIRRLSVTEPTARIVFYFALYSIIISSVPAGLYWQTPTLNQWGIMLAAGCLATIGQLLITRGYSLAPASQVGIYTYGAVIFAGLFGWWVWGETLDQWSLAGATIVIFAGALSLRASRKPQ